MSVQQGALLLADELDSAATGDAQMRANVRAAIELRRLHAVNAELLAALQEALPGLRSDWLALVAKYAGTPFEKDPAFLRVAARYENARAALAKATGSEK